MKIVQRYGNNIPLRISLPPVLYASALNLTDRNVNVTVIRQQGRTVPFAFSVEGNTIVGTILGKDQPNREDMLSLRITLDRGTERQQIIDVPNVVRLVSSSQQATLTATQQIAVIINGTTTNIMAVEQPRKVSASCAGRTNTHETMAEGARPDITLT